MNRSSLISPSEIVKIEECESSLKSKTLSIKECVTNFSETSVGSTVITTSSIYQVWEKIVGPDVSQHVKASHVKDKTLYVVADHSAWKTQLKYMNEQIITDLNQHLGQNKIESIVLSVR